MGNFGILLIVNRVIDQLSEKNFICGQIKEYLILHIICYMKNTIKIGHLNIYLLIQPLYKI